MDFLGLTSNCRTGPPHTNIPTWREREKERAHEANSYWKTDYFFFFLNEGEEIHQSENIFLLMSNCSFKTLAYLFLGVSVPQLHCPVVGGGDDGALSEFQHTDPVTVSLGIKSKALA